MDLTGKDKNDLIFDEVWDQIMRDHDALTDVEE